jgi:hypothetical protein
MLRRKPRVREHAVRLTTRAGSQSGPGSLAHCLGAAGRYAACVTPAGAGPGAGAALSGTGPGSAAAFSRARKAPSSSMVLISGAGNTTVVFLSTPISTRLCRFRSCSADAADVQVDLVGLRQRLVQGVLAHDLAQRGLRDLVDGRAHVLDRDHRLHRVDHPEVGDRGHIDADVIPGDDAAATPGAARR